MAVNNSLTTKKTPPFSVAIQGEGYKNLVNNTLGDPKRAAKFVTAITSAVSANPSLQDCDAGTILSAGLLGEGLNLSPSPQLGQYYLVPFNDNKGGRKVAQFQLGYKGYIQLAIRSGQYKKLNVLAIKEGELVKFDPLNEEIEVNLIEDEEEREVAETIGYYAMFEYTNGFRKAMYWSKNKMLAHADKYSQAFSKEGGVIKTKNGEKNKVSFAEYEAGNYNSRDAWMYSSFWYKDFDGMAYKTMLRQLISKWGIMSIEMQSAVDADMAVINNDGTRKYVDNEPIVQGREFVEADAKVIDEQPADPHEALFGNGTNEDTF